jgi:hypothetical protein
MNQSEWAQKGGFACGKDSSVTWKSKKKRVDGELNRYKWGELYSLGSETA